MKINPKTGIFLLLATILASCTNITITPVADSTNAASVNPTDTPSPTDPSGWAAPTHFSDPTAVVIPGPDQQVYSDPDGWYSVLLPLDMQATEKPNSFTRMGDTLETGYLPDLGYMSNIINVCAWIANIELKPENSTVDWGAVFSSTFKTEPRCSVLNQVSDGRFIRYEIHENPAADPEHRFVYIKISWSSFSAANGQIPSFHLLWLQPIAPRQEFTLTPLNDEEISEWRKIAPLLESASVTEYAMPSGSDPGQDAWLLKEVPEEALPDWIVNRPNLPAPAKTPTVEEQLQPLGYELRVIHEIDPYRRQLLRDGRVLFDYVYKVSEVYHFSTNSDPLTAFVVYTMTLDRFHSPKEFQGFLIQNDAIYIWEYNHQDPYGGPIHYQNEILWPKTSRDFNHIHVRKSNGEIIYSYAVHTEPIYAVNKFSAWNGHWILAARDFLIQDGVTINETFGFEEVFNWGLVEEKPVYLFRNGPRIGVSYDGKILPLEYQDVARYKCCGYATNNPGIRSNGIHFFGKRNGVWYYVVIEFNS